MEVTRIIHPIGQGAFYTERICSKDQIYNVVYDCGSGINKNAPKRLIQEIASVFTSNDVVDILFVSHFDNDHINGIRELKKRVKEIRNIVVPLVEKNDYWFYCVENQNFIAFYDSLEEIASHVYRVKPNINDERELNNQLIDLTEREGGIINGGAKFKWATIDWCYIPFNYDQKVRLEKLKAELAGQGVPVDIFTQDLSTIWGYLDKIKKAYKKVIPDGANKTSLIVYSGGLTSRYIMRQYQYCMRTRFCCEFCRHPFLRPEGCLYFGDNDVNQGLLLADLKNALNQVIDRIGTIQIPHHGALKNFNVGIFDINKNQKSFFVSFGIHNTYGHPSMRVIDDVVRSGSCLFEVTENRGSGYMQLIY